MIYPTLKATVKKGKIQLLGDLTLPENTLLLVTVIDSDAVAALSLGERILAGLLDVQQGNTVVAATPEELSAHLDDVFQDA